MSNLQQSRYCTLGPAAGAGLQAGWIVASWSTYLSTWLCSTCVGVATCSCHY